MARVGLVLGAGGIVGQAYHAGVLAALEHDLGWDPRSADVIVGTSAGSVTGTLLRLGVPAHDLAAWAVEAPLSVEAAPLLEVLGGDAPDWPPFTVHHWLRRWRSPSPALLARIARRPWAFRPAVAALTLAPTGRVDLTQRVGPLGLVADGWPEGLWICAARRDNGARVVFGRPGSPPPSLPEGVAASCAIPGYFAPIVIGGVEYFDGGVHSPTNADVLLSHADLDVVVVISPMSAAGGVARTADGPLRYAAHRRLEREVRRLRTAGATVVRFEPTRACLEEMGVNMMAEDRADRVVQEAFFETGPYAARPRIAARLAPLATRAAPAAAAAV
jgi:NTE family protein